VTVDERNIERQNELNEGIFEAKIKQVRSSIPTPGVLGSEDCVDCGTDIPLERRKLGYSSCVFCVDKKERRV
jgi:RNA polymerase-binding transcription factor DksA